MCARRPGAVQGVGVGWVGRLRASRLWSTTQLRGSGGVLDRPALHLRTVEAGRPRALQPLLGALLRPGPDPEAPDPQTLICALWPPNPGARSRCWRRAGRAHSTGSWARCWSWPSCWAWRRRRSSCRCGRQYHPSPSQHDFHLGSSCPFLLVCSFFLQIIKSCCLGYLGRSTRRGRQLGAPLERASPPGQPQVRRQGPTSSRSPR